MKTHRENPVSNKKLFDRRTLLQTATTVVVGCFFAGIPASAEEGQYKDFYSSQLPDLRPLGTQPAKGDEVAKADVLLLASPKDKSPIGVMRYLESLTETNVDGERYNGGWRVRWNPLF